MIFNNKLTALDGSGSYPVYYFFPGSFFALWAILRAGGISVRHPLGPVLFILCALFFRYVHNRLAFFSSDRRLPKAAGLCGLLFTLLCLLAARSSLTEGLSSRLFQGVILLACALGFFLLFYHALLLFFLYAKDFMTAKEEAPVKALPQLSFFFCLLCRLPYFLYEYPGIMSPDSVNQLEQVLGMVPYSNHHPFAHTMVMGLFYRIGRLFTTDVSAALSFFTVFQMCFMAFAVAWLIAALQRLGVKNLYCLLVLAFYALLPYHSVLAVTLWKDVLFSGAVLLFSTALLRLVLLPGASPCAEVSSGGKGQSGAKESAFSLSVYILSGLMLCLFRSNGWYAFLFSFPFLLYAFRRRRKRMYPATFCILIAALIIKGPVMDACHVIQPDFVESICIPLQQVARVICEDRTLTGEEWDTIHKVIDTTYLKELYAPGFADNMKELVRAGHPEYLASHKGEYLKLWLTLGLRYPGDYLQAYVDQTVGYWYPDTAYAAADIDGIVANDTGAASRPLIGGPLVVKTKEILLKLDDILPLYGLLSSMGAMLWTLLILFAVTVIKKQRSRYILFLPGLAVILTLLLATPVSSEFRYAYSLAYTLPLYILLPFLPE